MLFVLELFDLPSYDVLIKQTGMPCLLLKIRSGLILVLLHIMKSDLSTNDDHTLVPCVADLPAIADVMSLQGGTCISTVRGG